MVRDVADEFVHCHNVGGRMVIENKATWIVCRELSFHDSMVAV